MIIILTLLIKIKKQQITYEIIVLYCDTIDEF